MNIFKLMKIMNLAENGIDGEKENANAMLEKFKPKIKDGFDDDIWVVSWICLNEYHHDRVVSKAFVGKQKAEEFKSYLEKAHRDFKHGFKLNIEVEKQE